MTDDNANGDAPEAADRLVPSDTDAWLGESHQSAPSPVTEADPVLRSQLVEKTATSILDSGSIYGRHFEENQETPPWEREAWAVNSGYVTHNVYNFVSRQVSRDETAVAIEAALYAYGHSDQESDQPWLRTMERFAEEITERCFHEDALAALGLPEETGELVLDHQTLLHSDRRPPESPMTANTYNQETHNLSQAIQFTTLGGPYAGYVLVQIHGGCDIRGGYTAPRVYRVDESIVPHELQYRCGRCGWGEMESCLFDSDDILYQPEIDRERLAEALHGHEDSHMTPQFAEQEAHRAATTAEGEEHISGSVFHIGEGCCGHVSFS